MKVPTSPTSPTTLTTPTPPTDTPPSVTGRVTSGLGDGATFVSLPGYVEQFLDRLGYEPYPGTLNVDLDPEPGDDWQDARDRLVPIRIDGWEADGQSFGPARCYPVVLAVGDRTYAPAHEVVPERSDHDPNQLEVLAPDRLRDALALEDGDRVTVSVRPDSEQP